VIVTGDALLPELIAGETSGEIQAAFAGDSGRTRLASLYQQGTLRMLMPDTHDGVAQAIVANTSGGIVAGDALRIGVTASGNAKLLATSQAAEKVYRSTGADCLIETFLRAESGGTLEWLPQETILFEGARMRRRITLDVDATSSALIGETLVFGRAARGERLTRGLVHDVWQVRRDGRLVWADALRLDGDIAAKLDAPAGLGGAAAYATLAYVGEDAPRMLEDARRMLNDSSCRTGATCVNGVLIARWLSEDASALRRDYLRFLAAFRPLLHGGTVDAPTVW